MVSGTRHSLRSGRGGRSGSSNPFVQNNIPPMSQSALSDEEIATAQSRSLLDELIDTVANGSISERLRVLQRVTDLFVAGSRSYSNQQVALFDDVLGQLMSDVEVRARARLAQQMSDLDRAPPKLIRQLAFDDEIKVAAPVLAHSQQLSDEDLAENAATKSQEHLLAIAQRLKLSEAVTDVLVERGDRRVVYKVVRNKGASFSQGGYSRLTKRAHHDRRLTLALGRRSDIPRQYFLKLLETASASVRVRLAAANPEAAAAIRDVVGEVATGMQHETREASREYAVAWQNGMRRFKASPVAEANVHAPAQAQEFERTVVALSRLGRFPVDLVERAVLDEGEDMILILARTADCSWITARELLQMCAARRNLSPEDLASAFEKYKKLSLETARNVVRFHERRIRRARERRARRVRARARR